jgi:phosphoribosylformimino-5-aminoimidazole carboxamide ribotide isomerase
VGFAVIPAIDLRAGRVVRLVEGDFARETRYDDDPEAVALGFVAAGARWIHVVDLDGAKGEGRQTDAIERIVRAVAGRAACQVGGGLRSAEAVEAMLAAGASRVVLGTAILADPGLAQTLVAAHGSARIVAALDVRDGRAVGDGWVPGATGREVDEAIAAVADAGVVRFAVTSIARDGALGGPDLALLQRLVAARRGAIIASGGISSIADLEAVRDIGCEAAIVGRAIYEGMLDLTAALAALA